MRSISAPFASYHTTLLRVAIYKSLINLGKCLFARFPHFFGVGPP